MSVENLSPQQTIEAYKSQNKVLQHQITAAKQLYGEAMEQLINMRTNYFIIHEQLVEAQDKYDKLLKETQASVSPAVNQ